MSFKISLYQGEPVLVDDQQGKKIMAGWANGAEKIIINDIGINTSNIASIVKIDDLPEYQSLSMPERKYTSEAQKKRCEILDKMRAELTVKLGWKNKRDKFGNLIPSK